MMRSFITDFLFCYISRSWKYKIIVKNMKSCSAMQRFLSTSKIHLLKVKFHIFASVHQFLLNLTQIDIDILSLNLSHWILLTFCKIFLIPAPNRISLLCFYFTSNNTSSSSPPLSQSAVFGLFFTFSTHNKNWAFV